MHIFSFIILCIMMIILNAGIFYFLIWVLVKLFNLNIEYKTYSEYKKGLNSDSKMVEDYQCLKIKDLPAIKMKQFEPIYWSNPENWELRDFCVYRIGPSQGYYRSYLCGFMFTNYIEWLKYKHFVKLVQKTKTRERNYQKQKQMAARTEKYLKILQSDVNAALTKTENELDKCKQEFETIHNRMGY